MKLNGTTLSRAELGKFLPNPRTVSSFDDIQSDVSNMGDAVTTASFLTVGGEPSLGAERIFTPTSGDFVGTDGGANNPYTLALATTTVAPGTYGSASKFVSVTVDAKGRLTAASEFAAITTNVTEGTNLYYTDARARAALSGSTGISYNSSTGAIALANTAVAPASYGSATSVPSFTVDQQGRLTAASGNTIPALASGTYTPTFTIVANIDAVVGYTAQYLRVGSVVTVSGRVDIDPTAVATLTQLGVSLPIASTFTAFEQCGGAGMTPGVSGQGCAIVADATNHRAEIRYTPTDATSKGMFFSFTYQVL